MKKGKLLILLVAILSLTVFMASCDDPTDPAQTNEQTSATGVGAETPVAHEIRDYFDLDNGVETVNYSKVQQYDGVIVDQDTEHNLIALQTKDLDNLNNVVETVTVYNVLTGESLFEHTVKNLLGADEIDKCNLDVTIDYPIIRVSEQSYSEDGAETYDVSYYFAKKDSKVIRTTTDNSYERTDFYNGLVAFEMGEKVVWVDRNMEVVRTVDTIAANGYALSLDALNSEFQGYLYSWDESIIHVFNKAGICSAMYEIKHEGFLNVHVLNNGTVLIQDVEYVDGTESYDFKLYDSYCKLESYLMDPVDGKLTSVDLDFYVENLRTRYAEKYADDESTMMIYGNSKNDVFPFELAINRDNQAYIYKFTAGSFARDEQYVVLNNEMQIEYTVKNATPGIIFRDGYVLNENLYVAYVEEDDNTNTYIFDLDGNAISPFSYEGVYSFQWVTDKYIVTENGIYDHRMNSVYDLANGEFSGTLMYVNTTIDKIYFEKMNYETGFVDIYCFDDATQKPVLEFEGKEKMLNPTSMFLKGVYITLSEWSYEMVGDQKTNIEYKYTIYNMEGTPLLVTYSEPDFPEVNNGDILIVTAEFEGDPVVYVLQ